MCIFDCKAITENHTYMRAWLASQNLQCVPWPIKNTFDAHEWVFVRNNQHILGNTRITWIWCSAQQGCKLRLGCAWQLSWCWYVDFIKSIYSFLHMLILNYIVLFKTVPPWPESFTTCDVHLTCILHVCYLFDTPHFWSINMEISFFSCLVFTLALKMKY